MKKIILAVILATTYFSNVMARSPEVQKFEAEARIGITAPLGYYHGGSAQASMSLGMEMRFNIKDTPLDWGLMMELSGAMRDFNSPLPDDDFLYTQTNRTLALAPVCEYNFRQGQKFNPYVGAAIGIAFNDVVGDERYPSEGTSMLFAPRAGIEIAHLMRFGCQFNISRKGYNNVALTIGVVLGGRPTRTNK